MKNLKFLYDRNQLNLSEFKKIFLELNNEIENMNLAILNEYQDDRSSLNLLKDYESLEKIKNIIKEKLKTKPKYLILIGIGGSNLGTIAVQEAVYGKLYNQKNPEIKFLNADTVDSDFLNDIINIIKPVLEKGENVILNVVSKSGGTTETIANFEIILDLIKKYKKDYKKYVVVTTDKDSKLWNLAIDNEFDIIEIPKKVGGRYSVFSSVGLFPLGLLGLDVDNLLKGASDFRKLGLNKDIENNPAALSAGFIYINEKKGYNIHDFFLFSKDFESVGKWYRQLMGESIGKEFNIDNKQIFNGITPTVSIGSIDLHSMAQLYLGGPYDKFTTFLNIRNNKSNMNIPIFPEYSDLVDNIQGLEIKRIMDSIYEGVKLSYKKSNRPFVEIILNDKSAYSIGQLLQMKMMEIMFLGYLMKVNPFNQPNVEDYKKETKKILKQDDNF